MPSNSAFIVIYMWKLKWLFRLKWYGNILKINHVKSERAIGNMKTISNGYIPTFLVKTKVISYFQVMDHIVILVVNFLQMFIGWKSIMMLTIVQSSVKFVMKSLLEQLVLHHIGIGFILNSCPVQNVTRGYHPRWNWNTTW